MMDLTTILGLGLAGLVLYSIIQFQGSVSFYWNLEAFIVAVGGTFAASLLNTPWNNLRNAVKSAGGLVFSSKYSAKKVIPLMKRLSEKAKKEGIYSLKGEGKSWPDSFLDKCISMLMTNFSGHSIKKVMENEIMETRFRHKEIINIVRTMGLYAPVFGLFGTLVGVIQVLMKIGNPTEVGPSMAMAVMASVYGILLAYMVFHPIAGKLRLRDDEEVLAREMVLEGILLIQSGELPSVVERHLYSYLGTQDKAPKK
jgi:chemotaxis protein MotA